MADSPLYFCAVCGHLIHPYGSFDWKCDKGCRCLMLGCLLDKDRAAREGQAIDRLRKILNVERPPIVVTYEVTTTNTSKPTSRRRNKTHYRTPDGIKSICGRGKGVFRSSIYVNKVTCDSCLKKLGD